MKASDLLRRSGNLLRATGWCQGDYERGGKHCAVGALRAHMAGYSAHSAAVEVLGDVIGGDGGLRNILEWNDEPRRTVDSVFVALDAAYVLALQEEGIEPGDVL